jgi:hypothetical protein
MVDEMPPLHRSTPPASNQARAVQDWDHDGRVPERRVLGVPTESKRPELRFGVHLASKSPDAKSCVFIDRCR